MRYLGLQQSTSDVCAVAEGTIWMPAKRSFVLQETHEGTRGKLFKLNRYDPCVANKIVRGKQFTVLCHVDDLKMSHMEYDEVTSMINWLEGIYGDMKVSLGKKQYYLGMTIAYTKKGEVKVTIIDYMKGVIEDFPEVITGRSATPAADNLFEVRPDESTVLLEEKRAQAFYHAVAQLPFAS
jgi:hypothetical protein